MRTNFAGFALAVGMGLIVLLVGFAALSAAGLVGFAADASFAVQPARAAADSTAVPDSTAARALPVASYTPAEASAIAAGEALFNNNCAQCHAVHDRVVGPALAGITKRRPMAWLVPWVKNSGKVVASGDEYAVKLFNDYGKQQMPAFPQLSAEDIKNIMAWVTSQEGTAVQRESAAVAYATVGQ